MFDTIIRQQAEHKYHYVRGAVPCQSGISIEIRNNGIANILDGAGYIHSTRKRQYVCLIANVLSHHTIKDCYVNINLCDKPKHGYFNFNRLRGNATEFLLPNHRFTSDDVQIDAAHTKTANFDDTVKLIRSAAHTTKINKIYTSSIPHKNKLDYYRFAVINNCATGYAWLGSVHGNADAPPALIAELRLHGLCGQTYEPFIKHAEYKYVLYNDGNTLSDRMRLLLCLDAVILRSPSMYEEFYSYLLKDGENYIEYYDLLETYQMLEKENALCAQIALNNRRFIDEVLTYKNILGYTAEIINSVC
jgi:hypothetical protein